MSVVLGTCDVCHEYKEVSWCSWCQAYLCEDCKRKPLARARAAIERHM